MPTPSDDLGSRLLFTAPWEPIGVRRGDALGLRALADQFAEAVAPGFSNRIQDARWVTILSWCLVRSQQCFHASGERDPESRKEQRARYEWLRPLELMWVARTIALAEDDWQKRSLAGRRRVRRWFQDENQSTERFGLSVDQFRAYRQTGMYGGYRLAFRKWHEMTVSGDGWTPAASACRLATWLDDRLGKARPEFTMDGTGDEENAISPRSAKLNRKNAVEWWRKNWKGFLNSGRNADANTLPRRRDDFDELPESKLLKPIIFGDDVAGKRRLAVLKEIVKGRALDHTEICEHLGRVFAGHQKIALLPRFARLADAGIAVMDVIASELGQKLRVTLSDVAALPAASQACDELRKAAHGWQQSTKGILEIRHIEAAHRFASAVVRSTPIDCLRDVLQHHELYGGGLRWFVLRSDKIEPRTPPGMRSAGYRFRLWSLARMGNQCGITPSMPGGLVNEVEVDDIDDAEGSDE